MKNFNKTILFPIVLVILIFLKAYTNFDEPRLWAEEGTVYLKSAFEDGFHSIFKPHLGYYAFIPSITLYISSLFDYLHIPKITMGVSFFFWSALFFLIYGGGEKYSLTDKILFSLSLFFILMGNPEIFLNTINLQFITPIIVIIISYFYDNKKNILLDILLIICLLNGILGLLLIPLLTYRDYRRKNYKRIFYYITIILIHIFMIINFQTGQNNALVRIIGNIKLILKDIQNPLYFFKQKRLYWYYLVISFYFIYSMHKNNKLNTEIIVLYISCAITLVFIDLTKLPKSTIVTRYTALLYSLLYIMVFYGVIILNKRKELILSFVCLLLLIINKKDLNTVIYSENWGIWSKEHKNLYQKRETKIHPENWAIKFTP